MQCKKDDENVKSRNSSRAWRTHLGNYLKEKEKKNKKGGRPLQAHNRDSVTCAFQSTPRISPQAGAARGGGFGGSLFAPTEKGAAAQAGMKGKSPSPKLLVALGDNGGQTSLGSSSSSRLRRTPAHQHTWQLFSMKRAIKY